MKTSYFCNPGKKCDKRNSCTRYLEGLKNVFNKEIKNVPAREPKKCKDYIQNK